MQPVSLQVAPLIQLAGDLVSLLFPKLCIACGEGLMRFEKVLCTGCGDQLPETGFSRMANNPVERIFWGRVPVNTAFASYYFRKGSRIQSILHQIKYKNNLEAALHFGRIMGREFLKKPKPGLPDYIVPVPLHPAKLLQRGFNQSERLAAGFSEVTGIPVRHDLLIRNRHTGSQTTKERWGRIGNMQDVFSLKMEECLSGKHILLLDDVVTTGATAESCLLTLLKSPGSSVSFIALACA